jgi:hypothetical protein
MTAYQPNYPATVAEVLDPPVRFRPSVSRAVRRFAKAKPFRGTTEERQQKFIALHADLCATCGKHTALSFGVLDGGDSGASYYQPAADLIVLCGRLSVVTYLHEFAHALGRDERGAVRWSVNLFRASFPRSFARCAQNGHTLRRDVQPDSDSAAPPVLPHPDGQP